MRAPCASSTLKSGESSSLGPYPRRSQFEANGPGLWLYCAWELRNPEKVVPLRCCYDLKARLGNGTKVGDDNEYQVL